MASLALLAIRNFTTFFAAILIASPVAGFRPMRALLSTLTNRPIPGNTKSEFFFTSLTATSRRVVTSKSAVFGGISQLSAIDLMSCV